MADDEAGLLVVAMLLPLCADAASGMLTCRRPQGRWLGLISIFLRHRPNRRDVRAGDTLVAEDDTGRDMDAVLETVAIGQRGFLALVQQTPFFTIQMMQVLSDRFCRNSQS